MPSKSPTVHAAAQRLVDHAAVSPSAYALSPGSDPRRLLSEEWLLTDGLGGFAMGTALGVPTRRYHAWLIASLKPPVARTVLLHSCIERLELEPGTPQARSFDLSTLSFADGSPTGQLHPDGCSRLTAFSCDSAMGTCRWTYTIENLHVTRTLRLADAEPAAEIIYTMSPVDGKAQSTSARLIVRPFTPLRDFHTLQRQAAIGDAYRMTSESRTVRVHRAGITLRLDADAPYEPEPQWWYNVFSAEDAARVQDSVEDLFSPGVFVREWRASRGAARPSMNITARLDARAAPVVDFDVSSARRAHRISSMASASLGDARAVSEAGETITALAAAADQFIVRRQQPDGTSLATIIAGYPWFSDWGRDTCISLPGLMLATGRTTEAFETLRAFAVMQRDGIIPNCFTDQTGDAEYNTVDASLWFVHAACRYRAVSGDHAGFRDALQPACVEVVQRYHAGTSNGIAADPADKLIAAGSASTQLTWMDARRDGVVFTPRFGKAVEINALWYSALLELAGAMEPDRGPRPALSTPDLRTLAEAVAKSFRRAFWNPSEKCLFDCLTPAGGAWKPSPEVRPNQIFAVSLPHSPLSVPERQAVVACVREWLLTPEGLRTLSPGSPGYRPRYEGSLFDRDAAYHNGTVWPWLLGPYAEAVLRVGLFSNAARSEAKAVVAPMLSRLLAHRAHNGANGNAATSCGALGQIAEIFDAEPPRRVQGCPAQAWSIAEMLRVLVMINRGS
jgi:predicted glycogen debranching enzyme